MLRYLDGHDKKARSAKGTEAKIGKIKAALKALSVKQHRIATNLVYLVQAGWVEERQKSSIIQKRSQPVQVVSVVYRISNRGIDKFEGASKFQATDRLQGINITNIHGVTVIGALDLEASWGCCGAKLGPANFDFKVSAPDGN